MKYFIANWKQNFTLDQVQEWLANFPLTSSDNCKIVIAIPFPFLASPAIQNQKSHFSIAAQNISPFTQGTHTGQTGVNQLQGLVDYCLIGHPEVRRELGDTNKTVASKAKLLLNAKITPVICVDSANIDEQVTLLKHELLDLSGLVIAFEPLEAVGTGKPLPANKANEMCFKIKNLTNKVCPILYGGSINPDLASTYLSQEYIDGFLVGKSSLNPSDFAKIVSCETTS